MIRCRVVVWTLLLVLAASCVPAESVMPPEAYANMAEKSRIKATAVVESVKALETGKQSTWKSVVFKLRFPFTENVPEQFTGTCYSVDFPWQEPLVGGTLYYYPEVGDLVYVTVGSNGGPITSYTYLNDVMESLFIDNEDKIRYGMGNAWLDL